MNTLSPPLWSRPLLRARLLVHPRGAPVRPVVRKRQRKMFLTQNLAGQAVHHLVGGIKHAGCLRSGGEGGAAARDTHDQGLRARLLRFHRSQSRFGLCARGACSSAAAGVRATMVHQTLTALRVSHHGGSGPVVATGGNVGLGYACDVCKSVAFRFRPGCNTSPVGSGIAVTA